MDKPNEKALPEDIVNRLRHVVRFTGNEKAIDEDPVKILTMLLYGLEDHLHEGSIRYVIHENCSAEGVALRSRWLHKQPVT